MSPKVLKATTLKVTATAQPVTMPFISQQELAAYNSLTAEYEAAKKKVRQWEKQCEAFLSIVTGLSKKEYTKLSPDQFQAILEARFGKEFQLEVGEFDFAIDTKTERSIVSWKAEFIKAVGEAKAAVLKATAPKSYSHRFIVGKV